MNNDSIYRSEALPVELDLTQRILLQKKEGSQGEQRIRLSQKELPLLFALLRSYPFPGYITDYDAERATESDIEHVRQVIQRNLNIKLVPFSLEVVERGGTGLALKEKES